MKLHLPDARVRVLLALFRQLEKSGCHSVLVGGLVPPLLQKHFDPEEYEPATTPRSTADCDVAVDVAVSRFDRWREVEATLGSLGFEKNARENQFRWDHPCGLCIDSMPVPAGIERGDREALAFARTFVERDAGAFFRGYELALELFLEVSIELDDGSSHPLRIAGIAAMLSMKLQAWRESPERKKDAQDICWLLRYSKPESVARGLLEAKGRRPELMSEVIERLERHYSDADGDGVHASQPRYRTDEQSEPDRNAIARAVRQVLELYRKG